MELLAGCNVNQCSTQTSSSNLVWQKHKQTSTTSQNFIPCQFNDGVSIVAKSAYVEHVAESAASTALLHQLNRGFKGELEIRYLHNVYECHSHKMQGPTIAAAALTAIGIAVITMGTGASLLGISSTSSTGAVASAAMIDAALASSLTTATLSLCQHNGDIGKALRDLSSSKNMRSLLTSVASAGILSTLLEPLNKAKTATDAATKVQQTATLLQKIEHAVIRAGVTVTMSHLIERKENRTQLAAAFAGALAGAVAEHLDFKIADGQLSKQFSKLGAKFSKALVGSLSAGIVGGKQAMIGGALGAIIADMGLLSLNINDTDNSNKIIAKHAKVTELLAGFAALLTSQDIQASAISAKRVTKNSSYIAAKQIIQAQLLKTALEANEVERQQVANFFADEGSENQSQLELQSACLDEESKVYLTEKDMFNDIEKQLTVKELSELLPNGISDKTAPKSNLLTKLIGNMLSAAIPVAHATEVPSTTANNDSKPYASEISDFSVDLEEGVISSLLISTGRALVKNVQGITKLVLALGSKIGMVDQEMLDDYTAKISSETKSYNRTPVTRSISGVIGETAGDMMVASIIPGSAEVKGAKLVFTSAASGSILGFIEPTEDGKLSTQAINGATGLVAGGVGGAAFHMGAKGLHWAWQKGVNKNLQVATQTLPKPVIFSENIPKQTFTPGKVTGGNSRTLGANLNEAMGRNRSAPWTGYQAHHIIPCELETHPILQKAGIFLDDASNGIFLPTTKSKPVGDVSKFSRHTGPHAEYTNAIEKILDRMKVNTPTTKLQTYIPELQITLRKLLDSGLPARKQDFARSTTLIKHGLSAQKSGAIMDLWVRWIDKESNLLSSNLQHVASNKRPR